MTTGVGSGDRGGIPQRGAPVLKNSLETPLGKMGFGQVLRDVRHAESGQSRTEHLVGHVEDELPLDAHLQFAATFLELPGLQPAMRRQASFGKW
jgi:hypothetical protein